ncbi:MAG: hypothetical protein AB8B64_23320 [Granulosicoccus sp.]
MRNLYKSKLMLAIAGTVLGTPALSQDLFRSTNTTVHSYSYVEVQYLVDSDASPPLLAALLLDVSSRLSVRAEYLNQDYFVGANPEINRPESNQDVQELSIGGLYHQPFSRMKQLDWIAGFMLGRGEVNIELPTQRFNGTLEYDFQELYAGIRRTLASKLEVEALLNFRRQDELTLDTVTTVITGDAKLVYRAFDKVDVALAINEIGDGDQFGIGLRYTW